MFPATIDHPDSHIRRGKPTIRRSRKTWQSGFRLVAVEPPKVIDHSKDSSIAYPRRKYASIRFKYQDEDGHLKWKTLLFGDPDGQYVGNHIQDRRVQRYARLSHQQDPFHPNYWRLQILNTQSTMQQAYLSFMRRVMQIKPNTVERPRQQKTNQYQRRNT